MCLSGGSVRILLTGGNGFVGRHVYDWAKRQGHSIWRPTSAQYDLTDAASAYAMVESQDAEWDCVIHLAARVGGIGANRLAPATFWRDSMLMGINVLEACRLAEVQKIVMVGTTCSYPVIPKTIPFIEAELFDGLPEPTNAPYGIAKRSLLMGAWAYRSEFGMNAVMLVPTNMYGPGDHCELTTSHVIPALIRKIHDAKAEGGERVSCWGSGNPTRDFLYVEDAAQAIVKAAESYDEAQPLNLGSGCETSISALASECAQIIGWTGGFDWNTSKPDGQPRRCLNSSLAKEKLGWGATTSLHDGLVKTYDWYKAKVTK